ncbi:MAG: hypothetical protein Q7N95_05230 [Alphaproteobacteria bacterium]|nr:hypothetical protein [Alphaproteobacteria bacterium]
MIWLLAGAAFLLLGLLFLRTFASADPVRIAKGVRYGGATVLLALAAYLAFSGRTPIAILLVGWALLLVGRKPSLTKDDTSQDTGGPRRARSGLSRQEALDILGLASGATHDEVREAHKRLMQTCHPDHGGSSYLAARINAAKDVLLSR